MFSLLLLTAALGSDAVFLEHSVSLDCSLPDSTYIETTRDVIVPMTGRGVRRYAELSVTFRNTWESVDVLEASVRHWRPGRADGEAVLTESPHWSLLPTGRLESTLRELTAVFPGVEIGDTLVFEVERRIDRLPMADLYSYTFIPAAPDSILRSIFEVLWPSDRILHVVGDLGEGTAVQSGHNRELTLYSWSSGPVSGFPKLPFTGGMAELAPHVTVSSHTPEEVSADLWEVLLPACLSSETELADSIIAVTGGDPTALSAWIASEVEYLSGDWGVDPGYSPRLPHETLEERSGVCRDRVALLVWLLEEAGYDPVILLTSSGRGLPALAGSRSFDHVLVSVPIDDGRTIFLDPTLPGASDGFTYTLRGARYLPLTREGSAMMHFPEPEPGSDLLDIHISGVLDGEDMTVSGELIVRFSGAAEELFGSMFASVPDSSRGSLLETLFGCGDGSTLSLTGDPLDPLTSMTVTGSACWPLRSVVWEGGEALLLPGLAEIDLVGSRASAYILPEAIDHVFVETPYRCDLSLSISALPEGVILPPSEVLEGYGINMRMENGSLVMEESVSMLPMIPGPGELDVLREALAARLSGRWRTVVLP